VWLPIPWASTRVENMSEHAWTTAQGARNARRISSLFPTALGENNAVDRAADVETTVASVAFGP
jgi:hypothetical protein